MAELPVKRIVAVAAMAGALVGGAVAGVVTFSTERNGAGTPSPSGSAVALTTAAVVRTDLTNPVQVGGSIGYDGSYTVSAPTGTSPQGLQAGQQAVSKDGQALAADQQAAADTSTSDDLAIGAAQGSLNSANVALSTDRSTETQDCATVGATSAPCDQDQQKVDQDESQVTQAQEQVAAAQATAVRDQHQNEAKVALDQIQLEQDQATLASLQSSATNPGTTYTALPAVGAVIVEDQPVYSLSDVAVPLLYGSISAYRAFTAGMPDGADIGELTRDLIALGYGSGLAQSDHFGSATAAAIERWQAALGLPVTGEILLGEVVFEPGPIRVTSVTPSVGAAVGTGGDNGGGGVVLSATSTTPIVTVDLDVTQEYLVKPGDAVSVVLPDGTTTVGGHIESVGSVATCPGGDGTGAGGGGSGPADQSPCEAAGSGNSSTPTVTVTITLDGTPSGATLDQAPVNVDITAQRADGVLAVPVDALLALQGGGFGVEVVTARSTRLVGVTTGLYSNSMVQVSGSGLTVGTRVEVPSQ
ncbi:MAG TPA: peptidoglycan-binding domain-containing protein [Acidimicrobiales bacterium]|nr:peptidoglycan-binding domain-containing protein [Acidimicrobiales bacterium]